MDNVWAYTFLGGFTGSEMVLFVVFCNGVGVMVQLFGRILASCVWNKLVDLTEIERKRY